MWIKWDSADRPLNYPKQDSAFLTEVHHVNGDGEDAGVVYCEMQARENTAEELSSFLLLSYIYPGRCGYKSNTGGKMSNLRETCSNKKVSWPWICAHDLLCAAGHAPKMMVDLSPRQRLSYCVLLMCDVCCVICDARCDV